jgi:hypothetical protein
VSGDQRPPKTLFHSRPQDLVLRGHAGVRAPDRFWYAPRSLKQFDAINFAGIVLHKSRNYFFNSAPYVALHIVGLGCRIEPQQRTQGRSGSTELQP